MIKLEFENLHLHATDFLDVRDGLTDKDSFIASVSGNSSSMHKKYILNIIIMFSEPLFSLSNKMYLMFSSNSWGQDQGFSARFTRLSSLCGGDTRFKDQSLSIQSPRLPLNGLYRRGYISCR